MARSVFGSAVSQLAREAARASRLTVQVAAAAQRAQARDLALMGKQARQEHVEARAEEVDEKNEEIRRVIEGLDELLAVGLRARHKTAFRALKLPSAHPGRQPFTPPAELCNPSPRPNVEAYTRSVELPTALGRLIPGAEKRYQQRLAHAEARINQAEKAWQAAEAVRMAQVETLRVEHEAYRSRIDQHDKQIDEFETQYRAGNRDFIIGWAAMTLERSEYPEGFPQQFRVTYEPESRRLVVEYDLPRPDVIPAVLEYRYVRSKDSIEAKARKESEIDKRYTDVVASLALRTVHELFQADEQGHIDTLVFNGLVDAVDPATGQDTRRCLISVSAEKERFQVIDLSRVDRPTCLRNLGAQVSSHPSAIQPVRPIVEFDMADARFVPQPNVLADLESRPNLMDLDPFEFEHLVGNLFRRMGLETQQTRSSRDGGVDVVAFDSRPILGGRVVIQAKRYRHTVGVSAVRDLYGTMMNEGANKGILVTTSGYGRDAFEFAKDKPIELIQGGGLLYLLGQVGVAATIIFPQDGISMPSGSIGTTSKTT